MRRVLVVANQTLGGEELLAHVREVIAWGTSDIHLVVPETPLADLVTRESGTAREIAERRLADGEARFAAEGARVSGEIGPADPVEAVMTALQKTPCDEIILSTLPGSISAWDQRDVAERMRVSLGLPVTRVVAKESSWTQEDAPRT